MDDRRVLLVWAKAPKPGSSPNTHPVSLHQPSIQDGSLAFLEDWDAETKELKQRVPMPAGLTELLAFADDGYVALGRLRTYKSAEHVLFHIEGVEQLYGYSPRSGELLRLGTPWTSVQADAIRKALHGAPPAHQFIFQPLRSPTRMMVSPRSGGGFAFAWCDLCLTTTDLQRVHTNNAGSTIPFLHPADLRPDRDCPSPLRFHIGTWEPGKDRVEETSLKGWLDPNNLVDPDVKRDIAKYQGIGLFVTRDHEVQPLDQVLSAIRKAAQAHGAAPAGATPVAPKQIAPEPKPAPPAKPKA